MITASALIHPGSRTGRTMAAALAAATALSLTALTTPAVAQDLAQVVTADERIAPAGEFAPITHGHIDLGGLAVAEGIELMARDDTGGTPVWRRTEDMPLVLGDAALEQLPQSDEFSFVGASAGDMVWVVPQTEVPGVPWLGWNTQAPSLIAAIGGENPSATAGVTLSITGHQGPGEFSLFLHQAGFGAPEVLAATAKPTAVASPTGFFVPLHTHTHANWVFTEPGVHAIGLELSAPSATGEMLRSHAVLRFAVGDGTDPAEAAALTWDPEAAAPAMAAATGLAGISARSLWLIGGTVLLIVVLLAVGIISRRARGGNHG